MEKLEIYKTNAIKAFQKADKAGRQLLTELFGEKALSQKITDRIVSMTDVYNYHGVFESDVLIKNVHPVLAGDLVSINGYIKLILMIRALNEHRIPNWDDSSEYKWWAWWKMRGGFGFSRTGYGGSDANSDVGSRLLLLSEELQLHAAKYFPEQYRQYMEYTSTK